MVLGQSISGSYSGFSLGNTTGLGNQGRTGPAILTSSVRCGKGSINRVYNALPPGKRQLFISNQLFFLYGKR